MKTNGEAIYGTTASPFKKLNWGRCTRKSYNSKTLLYFHVFDFPSDGMLTIPGLVGKVYKAYPLSDKNKDLKVISAENGPRIDIGQLSKNEQT